MKKPLTEELSFDKLKSTLTLENNSPIGKYNLSLCIKPDMSYVPTLSIVICIGASSARGLVLVRIESKGSHSADLKTETSKKKAVLWLLCLTSVNIYGYFLLGCVSFKNLTACFFSVCIKLNCYGIISLW